MGYTRKDTSKSHSLFLGKFNNDLDREETSMISEAVTN